MSENGKLPTQNILPSITGNAGLDGVIRTGIVGASGILTGVVVGWLNAHGFKDPNLYMLVSGTVFSLLTAGAMMVWGYISHGKAEKTAQQALVAGVQAGAAFAQDESIPTPPAASISPTEAKTIVAAYAPNAPSTLKP